MNILLKEVTILDPSSPHHLQVVNVCLKNGIIQSIDQIDHHANTEIDGKGKFLSLGWFDLQSNFNDPGLEHKEDIETGCATAAHGGFTGVATLPNTLPVVQTKSHVAYIKVKSIDAITDLFPIAAVTTDAKGEDLTEMLDLHQAGAVAFSDGEHAMWHTDLTLKSLIYLQKIEGLLINQPADQLLTRFGTMNEGVPSTILGLTGMPALAEHLMIKRDLDLLAYAGGKIHFSNISSKGSVWLIKKAKAKGLQVTCDVSIHHLLHTDKNLMNYDTNYKIKPPLRSERDRLALIKGLKQGTIDCIVSAHSPHDEECKKLEFDRADFGAIGLQTVLPALVRLGKSLSPEEWIEKITTAPRTILKLEQVSIVAKQKVNLTLFDINQSWRFNHTSNQSKSINSPYFGQLLTGKVNAIFNGTKFQLFDS